MERGCLRVRLSVKTETHLNFKTTLSVRTRLSSNGMVYTCMSYQRYSRTGT